MKKVFMISMLAAATIFATSCSDWDDHFDEAGISSTDKVDIYNGDIVSYMKNMAEVSKMSEIYEKNGVYQNTAADKSYTFIICDNNVLNNGEIADEASFADYCVSDIALSPSTLQDGFGIQTRLGKQIWVQLENGTTKLENHSIKKIVKTNNGYIYYMDGVLPIRQSVYEYLKSLDDTNYSMFKKLVMSYDTIWFDREHSTIVGITQDGSTLYDSVIVTRNTLMDRYSEDGQPTWNMRDEKYNTTMFIPTNAQIVKAIKDACDNIPEWLNRNATAADSAKFYEWIVKACFVDHKLPADKVASNAKDFQCVGDYQQIINEQTDQITYKSIEPAYWKPSVQLANTSNQVQLSNGNAYFLESLKIPNNIVIYRVKSRMYQIWNALGDDMKRNNYFTWTNLTAPTIIQDVQGSFYSNTQTMGDYPDVRYDMLTAIPTTEAIDNELTCSVEYLGLICNEDETEVFECNLPAGEYYLRMGFVHSLTYSLSIYFDDEIVAKDIVMGATASNFHFDRGGASDIPNYGTNYKIGYPEGFNPSDWLEINENANLYDTDGWNVGIVRIKQEGTFKIKIESKDESKFWALNGNTERNKNNKNQIMMYHWCLRPTSNNY